MSKVFACLCALLLIVSVGATADETVNFTAVDSQGTIGLASYTATVTGGFSMGNLDWDGMATELVTGTYGSELTCAISGPLGTATVTLGTGSGFTGPVNFTGSYPAFAGSDPAGVWTFDFYESYDDGADGLADATWNTIDFTYVEQVIVPGEEVCFTAVDSQAAAGVASYTATVTGGFELGGLDWLGFATTIASGTYGSELTCAISGPLGAWTVQLGSGSGYSPGATFFGSDPSVVGIDPAGVWTFDFYETYDDLGDLLPDATWDDICFLFVEAVPVGEEVCFTAVDSQAGSGLVSYTATLTGGYSLGDIDWDGFATTIASGTYGSELTLNLSGPLGAASITLGSGSGYAPGAAFSGNSALFGGAGDPAGVWTFDFYETYDDLGDLLPDATWDDICFFFSEAVGCFGPDTCDLAELVTTGVYSGSTAGCTNAFSSYSLWGWLLEGNDHIYAVDVPCAGSEICVTLTPLDGQDPAVGLGIECSDGSTSVTLLAGADNGLDGDPESFCYTTTGVGDTGTLFIFVDSYGAGSGGAYDLDVSVVLGTQPNDTCATAIDVTGGGIFSGSTLCALNDYDVSSACIDYATGGADVVYAITVADGDTVDFTVTPYGVFDPAFYVVGDCADPEGTCMGGADAGLDGDPEFASIAFECAGTYYIMVDSYYAIGGTFAAGDFDLDVAITPATPVDTFDVSMVCDPDPLNLPTQTKIRVYIENVSASARMFCGNVGVTLCNGVHISNIRAGSLTLPAGETKFIGWGQVIPALATTCDCTLVFDVDATDCTPCDSVGLEPAGWNEIATCGITTVCP